jgi:N-acetyl sugar amidotransferase
MQQEALGTSVQTADARAQRATEPRRMCVRCIMDTSAPDIRFDAEGVCDHCRRFDEFMATGAPPPEQKQALLTAALERIAKAGRGRDYDCVVGLSGGVDSSYVAMLVKDLGLRALVVHVDNGWDSPIAVRNIERVLGRTRQDLVSIVLDWEEFKDLQLAFLRASTPDSEIPTDHAITAGMYKLAWSRGIPYVVTGCNRATELVLPPSWSQGHCDWRYLNAVHERYGHTPLRSYPRFDAATYARFRWWSTHRTLHLLEYVPYSRAAAAAELKKRVGWTDYGGKHYESIYTRFFQGWILPTKFGFDKRRAHLANAVLAGHCSRERALEALRAPPYASAALLEQDRGYVLKKLGLDEAEFGAIMRAPPRRYADYPNLYNWKPYLALRAAYRAGRGLLGRSAPFAKV